MAAVEKRRPPAVALLTNHLMFSVISFFIVLNMPEGGFQVGFGVFFLILYLFGVYDYSNRDGIEHTRSYSTIKPSFKYPLMHGLIGMSYLILPLLIFLASRSNEVARFYTFLFFLITNAQFEFTLAVQPEYIKWATMALFCLLIIASSILGYLAGIKGFRIAAVLSKYLYVRKKK